MGVFVSGDGTEGEGHEQVVYCRTPSGLRAIIAIYSTALGPALGGTRFYPYARCDALARRAGTVPRDGVQERSGRPGPRRGKAVIWGDPDRDKSEPLLRAYGRFVQSLGGRYYTACDVGTYVQDMDVVARETRFVTGRSEGRRRRRLVRADRVRACSRACGRRRSTVGHPDLPAGGSASPAWARWASTLPGICSTTGPRGGHRRLPSGRSRVGRPPAGRPGRGRATLIRADSTCTRRARSAGRSTTRPRPSCGPSRRRCCEQPTRAPGGREALAERGSSTRRTTWSTPAG